MWPCENRRVGRLLALALPQRRARAGGALVRSRLPAEIVLLLFGIRPRTQCSGDIRGATVQSEKTLSCRHVKASDWKGKMNWLGKRFFWRAHGINLQEASLSANFFNYPEIPEITDRTFFREIDETCRELGKMTFTIKNLVCYLRDLMVSTLCYTSLRHQLQFIYLCNGPSKAVKYVQGICVRKGYEYRCACLTEILQPSSLHNSSLHDCIIMSTVLSAIVTKYFRG